VREKENKSPGGEQKGALKCACLEAVNHSQKVNVGEALRTLKRKDEEEWLAATFR
jgi:hypothetical protein